MFPQIYAETIKYIFSLPVGGTEPITINVITSVYYTAVGAGKKVGILGCETVFAGSLPN